MTLGVAAILLLLDAAGLVLAIRFLRSRPKVRILCIVLLALLGTFLAGYIGLTLLFVDAVSNQPPAA